MPLDTRAQLLDYLASLQKYTANPTIPQLPADILAALNADAQQQMQFGSAEINRQVQKQLADLVAKGATRGTLGSTGYGAAAGNIGGSGVQALQALISQLQTSQLQQQLAMRQGLMNTQAQMYGVGAQIFPGLYSDEQEQKATAWTGILGALGNIGKAIPGVGGALAGLFQNPTQQVPSTQYNTSPTLKWPN